MIVTTEKDWDNVVDALRSSRDPNGQPVIGYDTETVDRGWPDVKITGFSLSWYTFRDGIKGCYVPIGHNNSNKTQLTQEQIRDDLAKILESREIQVTCHNVKYDRNVSLLFDDPIEMDENVFDTMVAAWLTDTCGVGTPQQRLIDKGSHGLKAWVKDKLGYEMTELSDICPKEKDENDNTIYLTDEIPIEEMGDYAGDDAIYTLMLREWLIENEFIGKEEELWDVYKEIERRFLFVLADLEKWGMEIDEDMLREMGSEIKAEIDRIHEKMFKLRPGSDFENDDPEAIKECALKYEGLEQEEGLSPYKKGQYRKTLFQYFGIEDTAAEEKIRDDRLRPDVIKWPELAHKVFNVNSTHQLNEVLFEECGIEPIGKPTEASGLYSTSADNIQVWAEDYEIAEELNRLRILTKLDGTYIEGILSRLSDDGRIRTVYNMIITTGRLSSRNPNLQNIINSDEFPIRECFVGTGCSTARVKRYGTRDGSNTKHCRVSNEGGFFEIKDGRLVDWGGRNPPWPIFVGDYSQLEIRILAHFSQDKTLLETLREGLDVHGQTARMLSEPPFDQIPDDFPINRIKAEYPDVRNAVKPINFGIIYGIGPNKLSKDLGITKEEAQRIIDQYLDRLPGVKRYIERQHDMAHQKGFVKTLAGRKRHLPAARLQRDKGNYGMIWQAERQAQNTPIQGSAADIINKAMINIADFCRGRTAINAAQFTSPSENVDHSMDFHSRLWGNWLKMLIQVHDELVIEMHPSIANWAKGKFTKVMEDAYTLDVPLKVDSNLGYNWWETK